MLEDSAAGIMAASRAAAMSVDPQTVELCDFMVSDLAELAATIFNFAGPL